MLENFNGICTNNINEAGNVLLSGFTSVSPLIFPRELTHWGRVTHICVSKLAIIGSDNGLSPGRRQAIIWTNAGILLIRPLETNFIEILIRNQTFSFKKMYLKMSSAKWRLFYLGFNVLTQACTARSVIAPVPAKQPWWIWINISCEFIMNDCITTTKQSTTKPCAYFLGYTVCMHWSVTTKHAPRARGAVWFCNHVSLVVFTLWRPVN